MNTEPGMYAGYSGTPQTDAAVQQYWRSAWLVERRVYFQKLAQVLAARGAAGKQVGEVIAELDHHVEMTSSHPIEEFGEVGEYSETLRETMDFRPARVLAFVVLFSAGCGMLYDLALAWLKTALFEEVSYTIGFSGPILGIMLGAGSIVAWNRGSRSLKGVSAGERPNFRSFIPVVLLSLVATVLTGELAWELSVSNTIGIALASLILMAAGGVPWYRYSVLVMPGDAPHLRDLQRRRLSRKNRRLEKQRLQAVADIRGR